jgi:hypothetical protein
VCLSSELFVTIAGGEVRNLFIHRVVLRRSSLDLDLLLICRVPVSGPVTASWAVLPPLTIGSHTLHLSL